MQRRKLLKWMGTLPLSGAACPSGVLAAPTAPAKLLVVFLRGGYDAASLLVPVGSDFYYQARPTIAIPKPTADTGASLALTSDWALHPAFEDSIYPLFQAGEVAFVPFAGTDDLTRSHFETQDTIELGQGSAQGAGHRNYRSGFLNRLAAVLNGARPSMPIAFTDQLPLIFQGDVEVPNIALRNTGKPALDERQTKIITAMYGSRGLGKRVAEGFATRDDVMRDLTGEMTAANRNAVNAKGFELEAQRMALLMKDKYQLGFIDVGGWDTHVNQGAANGYLAGRFVELGRGLTTFARTMGPDWNKTVVVLVSEFGRTFRENGNRGTDHGHGTVFWVLGGGVRGGTVVGEQVELRASNLFQNRDYPVLNEYRTVLGGLFSSMYGLNAAQVNAVFAGTTPRPLGLI